MLVAPLNRMLHHEARRLLACHAASMCRRNRGLRRVLAHGFAREPARRRPRRRLCHQGLMSIRVQSKHVGRPGNARWRPVGGRITQLGEQNLLSLGGGALGIRHAREYCIFHVRLHVVRSDELNGGRFEACTALGDAIEVGGAACILDDTRDEPRLRRVQRRVRDSVVEWEAAHIDVGDARLLELRVKACGMQLVQLVVEPIVVEGRE